MSDKIQSFREPGICMETGNGRSADPSPRPTQKQLYSSSSGSSNGRKQQNKNKGNYGSSKDKRQHHPRSGPGAPVQHPGVGGPSSQGSTKAARYHGDRRWSGQRNKSPRQDNGRDRLKETENVSSKFPGVCGSPVSRPGSADGGRRKSTPVSLNHLLNFTVAPTERRNSASGGGMSSIPLRRRRARLGHSYNKEQFLQANCQFVVSASGDYSIHSGDPDRLVEWDRIQQVRLFCHQIPSCPICLYPPTAAKITRCGHVYCWSCVLHYLALGEKKWRKCPICYESIYKQDLKSVIALSNPQFKVGDTITMKLMMREKGTTVVCPKTEWPDRKSSLLTLTDGSSIRQFVKLLSATPTETLELITGAERCELEAQMRGLGEDGASERCFVEAALEELKVREAALKQAEALGKEVDSITQVPHEMKPRPVSGPAESDPPTDLSGPVWTAYADSHFEGEFTAPFSDLEEETAEEGETTSSGSSETASLEDNPSITEDKQPSVEASVQLVINEGCIDGNGGQVSQEQQQQHLIPKSVESESPLSVSSTGSPERSTSTGSSQLESTESSPQKDPLVISSSGDSPRLQTSGDIIYFYQAADGQHLYIHPINAKCLAKEYGGLENAPEEIKATVVEMEQLTMSEDVRCRYRYLSHLPLTCEFVLCELDLKPPILSQDTLKVFSDDLQKRKQKRIKKKREERRRERKCEPNSEPVFHVPTEATEMTPERFHDFLSLASSPPLPSSFPPRPLSSTPPSRHSPTEQERGALANGDGGSAHELSVESDSLQSAPSFAQALRGKPTPVWPIKQSQKPQESPRGAVDIGHRGRLSVEEDEKDGEVHVIPSFQNAFNEALLSASVSVLAAQSASGGKPGSKTAKKGRKKLVLFSTGGMRGVN